MRLWLIFLLLAGAGFAQTAPKRAPAKKAAAPTNPAVAEAPSKWPVEALTVEGNRNYTREQVLAVAGLKVGQLAGKPEFEAARDRLTASGVFETVGYKFEPGPNKEGFVASFQVTEVEPVYAIHFEELGVPEKELESLLHAKDPLYISGKLPATKPLIDRYTNWIQEFLTSKGLTEKIAGKGDSAVRGSVRDRLSPGAQSAGGRASDLSGQSGDPAGRIARGHARHRDRLALYREQLSRSAEQ